MKLLDKLVSAIRWQLDRAKIEAVYDSAIRERDKSREDMNKAVSALIEKDKALQEVLQLTKRNSRTN